MDRDPSPSGVLVEPLLFVTICMIVGVVIAGATVTAIVDRLTGNRIV